MKEPDITRHMKNNNIVIITFIVFAVIGCVFVFLDEGRKREHQLEMAKIGYVQVIENGEKVWKPKEK